MPKMYIKKLSDLLDEFRFHADGVKALEQPIIDALKEAVENGVHPILMYIVLDDYLKEVRKVSVLCAGLAELHSMYSVLRETAERMKELAGITGEQENIRCAGCPHLNECTDPPAVQYKDDLKQQKPQDAN